MRSGLVATFYSYKGGVGRSFLLANVAVLLAKWGYRVLCVDWDVEAPGLDEYFRPWLGGLTPGLIELVTMFEENRRPNWRQHVSDAPIPGAEGRLSIMTSGILDATYTKRVQSVDWRSLYDRKKFGAFLENVRDEWKSEYDFILIDSRTGITDVGGICTVHMPDLLVFLFTANQQSLDGVTRVVRQAQEQRNRLPLNRGGLLTLPIPSRFDGRGQDAIATEWLRKFTDALSPFYEPWVDAELNPRQVLDLTRVPYFSVWTFGERLTVLEERYNDPERISYHFATIAALVARRLGDTDQLVRSRDMYVEGALSRGREATEGETPSAAFHYDFYLSYGREHVNLARVLYDRLRSAGLRVFIDTQELASGFDFRATLEGALARTQTLVLFIGVTPSTWQVGEAVSFLALDSDSGERTVRILNFGDEESVAPFMRLLQSESRHRVKTHPALGLDADELTSLLLPEDRTKTRPIDNTLRKLAHAYEHVRIVDYNRRVRRKDELTYRLGEYVIEHRISRDALAAAKKDGMAVALAEAAALAPERGDLHRLLRAGPAVTMLHTSFRILLTISRLIEHQPVQSEERAGLLRLLDMFEDKARTKKDRPLLTIVETTRRRLENTS